MTILLVDASNLAHRARYSYSLSNRGQDTSVTYGVLRMLMALVKSQHPDGIVMCFDGGRPHYRQTLIPQYKAHRKHDDDPTYVEFIRQMAELFRMLPYFGTMCVKRDGVEADDLMYHASRMLDSSLVVTNDDDLLQAVNENTSVLKSSKKEYKRIGLDNFSAETGVDIDFFLMAKVFIGDSSDNVPGVQGIGPATVSKMFATGYPNYRVLNENLQDRLRTFMEDGRFEAALKCIDLRQDLSGARQALLDANWVPYNNKIVYKYCIDNAFTSLIEAGSLGQTFGALRRPQFRRNGYRVPRIWDTERHPCEF